MLLGTSRSLRMKHPHLSDVETLAVPVARQQFVPRSFSREMHIRHWYAILLCLLACADEAAESGASRIEGRTPAVSDGASLYALRLWTAPVLDSLNRAGVRVDSLDVAPAQIHMRRGERLPLARLHVVALDSLGHTVLGAPIVLEVGSGAITLTYQDVLARAAGIATLRVRSLLRNESGVAEEREIPVRIDE